MAKKVARSGLTIEDGPEVKPTAQRPDVMRFVPGTGGTTKIEVDEKASARIISISGNEGDHPKGRPLPTVYYELKSNKYFKDKKFEKTFSDEELHKLGLPIPAEIENERRKLRKKIVDGTLEMTLDEVLSVTAPRKMKPQPTQLQKDLKELKEVQEQINKKTHLSR